MRLIINTVNAFTMGIIPGIGQMNPGGDAAEQVVRLSLEGVEVAAKITGNGAKNIALLLYAALKEEQKTKGKARLTSMLKSGKELKVYTITQNDLAKFSQEAKRYGVLYCVLKDRNNKNKYAAVDIIARADDASKIQRITERFRLATVSKADVSLEAKNDRDRLFPNPSSAKTERDHLSEPSSAQATKTDRSGAIPGTTSKSSGMIVIAATREGCGLPVFLLYKKGGTL